MIGSYFCPICKCEHSTSIEHHASTGSDIPMGGRMTFDEWANSDRVQPLWKMPADDIAQAAWDAALEEAARIVESLDSSKYPYLVDMYANAIRQRKSGGGE